MFAKMVQFDIKKITDIQRGNRRLYAPLLVSIQSQFGKIVCRQHACKTMPARTLSDLCLSAAAPFCFFLLRGGGGKVKRRIFIHAIHAALCSGVINRISFRADGNRRYS